jgi:HD-like signal output (HDOD) protein
MLSRFCGVDPGEAFVAGLLHDVGIAASLIAISDHFKAKALPPVDSVWSAVLDRHSASGAMLQQSWGLPQNLGHVIAHHHAPKQATSPGPLPALVALADALVSEFGVPILDEVPEDAASVAEEALGLDAGLLERARGAAQNLVELIEQRD